MHVVFAIPFVMENTLRFVRAVAGLSGVELSLVSQDHADKVPDALRRRLVGFERVEDAMSAEALTRGVAKLAEKGGPVERLVGILEPLQEPLAKVREQLRIRGMDEQAARNFRDKSRMKEVFADADIPCARHRLCGSLRQALQFAAEVGYPLVGKPPAGAGAKATSRCADEQELREFVQAIRPLPGREVLLEEFVRGREFSFDSLTLQGRHVLHNICCYYPSPLEVIENPWIQWCVVLPRELDRPEFRDIHAIGPKALDALGMWTGVSHMEWFRKNDGSIAISEVAARPPGAQFVSLMGHVLDTDMFALIAQALVFEQVRVPPRKFAAGAVYLRGQAGAAQRKAAKQPLKVRAVHGLEALREEFTDLIVELQLPRIGAPAADTYEGDGFVIVRHRDTEVVREAVQRIVRTVRVELG